eukprot:scaffold24220_cov19-Tisochrysis_lutea.AAC.1
MAASAVLKGLTSSSAHLGWGDSASMQVQPTMRSYPGDQCPKTSYLCIWITAASISRALDVQDVQGHRVVRPCVIHPLVSHVLY